MGLEYDAPTSKKPLEHPRYIKLRLSIPIR